MEAHATLPNHPAFRTKHPSPLTFEKVLGVLAVITFVEVIISILHTGGTLTLLPTALLLIFFSLVKATFVAGYFMHLFYEKRPFVIFMLAFGFPLLIILPVAIMVVTV